MTDVELLNEIDKGITAILSGGQSYEVEGRKFTRADLNILWSMRKEVETRINFASNSSQELARF